MSQESHASTPLQAPALSLPMLAACAAGLVGILALLASLVLPWFKVPGESARAVTWIFRVWCLAAFAGAIFCHLRRKRGALEWCLLALCLAGIFFPYAVTVWCPNLAGQAAWLEAQHESLTTTTGDLYLTQEDRDSFWRQRVSLVNRPIDSQIVSFPDWGAQNLAWMRGVEMCEWLGMSPWFALFLCKGWACALLGAGLILGAWCRLAEGAVLERAARLMRRGAVLLCIAAALALTPPLAGSLFLKQAKQAAQAGESAHSLALLTRAARCFPAIRADGDYVVQKGLLENVLGIASPEAEFYRARSLEEQGFNLQARSAYLTLAARPGLSPALLRECVKSHLRQGIAALNSGEPRLAADLLETALQLDPHGIKASFALELACLRLGDLDGISRSGAQLADTYRSLNTPLRASVLAVTDENLAFGEVMRGHSENALASWRAAQRR